MTIYVPNDESQLNKWIVDDETESTYKISCSTDRRIITEIYKSKCFVGENNELISTEKRKTYMTTANIAFASFCNIYVD